jgi:hypothetical protein
MNKFQKLAQLNRDIELLEKAGKIKSADILHQKFIKEAQLGIGPAYPQVGLRKPQMGKMDLAVTPVSNIGPNPERNNDVQTSPQGAQNSGDGLTVNKGNIIYPEDTANENAEVLFAEKMKKRIQYYEGKIKEYHEQTDLKYKEKMLLYLTTYMDKNYDQGELDPNSYSRLMNALGEKSGIS